MYENSPMKKPSNMLSHQKSPMEQASSQFSKHKNICNNASKTPLNTLKIQYNHLRRMRNWWTCPTNCFSGTILPRFQESNIPTFSIPLDLRKELTGRTSSKRKQCRIHNYPYLQDFDNQITKNTALSVRAYKWYF